MAPKKIRKSTHREQYAEYEDFGLPQAEDLSYDSTCKEPVLLRWKQESRRMPCALDFK
jgi:hypothetical protein